MVLSYNGWKIFAHPAFFEPYAKLVSEVETLALTEVAGAHPKAKLLKRIQEAIRAEICREPGAPEFQQGNTLGPTHRHWRRAKFLRRYRLFFRYSAEQRIIILGWLNDEGTLRKAGASSDPYAVFAKRLKQGRPPSDWDTLLRESRPLGDGPTPS